MNWHSTYNALFRQGWKLILLAAGTKRPLQSGWRTNNASVEEALTHLRAGGNVGICPQAGQLIVDVDKRHDGYRSLEMLRWDFDLDFSRTPTVSTGGGGEHYYVRVPPNCSPKGSLATYPGIDFLGVSRFAVGPGSTHPNGRTYDLKVGFEEEPITIPRLLMETLSRAVSHIHARDEAVEPILSSVQLRRLLNALDPSAYGHGHHDEWLRLALSCHAATAGEGRGEWLAWCAKDEEYGSSCWDENAARWDSFSMKRNDGITYRTLFKAVSRAGRPDLVARIGDLSTMVSEADDVQLYAAEEQ